MTGASMPWQWACLSCNQTWSASTPHACVPQEHLRSFWCAILRWSPSLRDKSGEQVRALVSKPIARALLTQLLGAPWDPAGDGAARMPSNKAREAAS